MPATMSPETFELPNPLLFRSGVPVQTPGQWRERRREMHALMVPVAYGELPPVPDVVQCVVLHIAIVKRLGGARLLSCRVLVQGGHAFLLRIFVPLGSGPFPVVLNGDGCWHCASDDVIAAWVGAGYGFAQFNRVELAPDAGPAGDAGIAPGPMPLGSCPALWGRALKPWPMWWVLSRIGSVPNWRSLPGAKTRCHSTSIF